MTPPRHLGCEGPLCADERCTADFLERLKKVAPPGGFLARASGKRPETDPEAKYRKRWKPRRRMNP